MSAPSAPVVALMIWLSENPEGKPAHFAKLSELDRFVYLDRAEMALKRAGKAWTKPHKFQPLRHAPDHCKVCRYPASEPLKHGGKSTR